MHSRDNSNPAEHISEASATAEAGGLSVRGSVFDIKRYAIHDGPGIRTTVFFKGCPLACQWCHNPESRQSAPEPALRAGRCIRCGQCVELCRQDAVSLDGGLPRTDAGRCTCCGECIEACPGGAREIIGCEKTVGEVMAEVEKDVVFYKQSGGGVTFSGGEPLCQFEFLLALLSESRARKIHAAVDTTCYAEAEVVDAVGEKADLLLCDIKHMDSARHREFTGVDNDLILDNIRRLCRAGREVVIRVPIIPGFNDDQANIKATGRFAASLCGVERIDILPYNRGGNEKAKRLAAGIDLVQIETPTDKKMRSIAAKFRSRGFKVKIGG